MATETAYISWSFHQCGLENGLYLQYQQATQMKSYGHPGDTG